MASRNGALYPLRHLLDRRARLAMLVIGTLRLAERILLAVVALSFSSERLTTVVAIGSLLAALAALRATVRAPLLAVIRLRFTGIVARAMLRRRALARASRRSDTGLVIFDALWAAEELCAGRLPGLAADAVAAILLGGFLVSTLSTRFVVVSGLALLVAGLAADGARRLAGAHAQRSYDAFLPVVASVEGCIHAGVELVGNGRARDHERLVRVGTEHWVRTAWRADWLAGLSGRLPLALGFLGLMIGLVYVQLSHGTSLEAAFGEALVVASVLPPFASILTSLVELTHAMPKIEPLQELLDADAAPMPKTSPSTEVGLPRLPATIEWSTIDYAYPTRDGSRGPRTLSGLSGQWRAGQVLGIAGPNGAGKSTLFRLLLALDRPTRGSIFVGGRPLRDLDEDAWRRAIAYLPQRPFFSDTASVRDAMRFIAHDATEDEMARALQRVGLWARLVSASGDKPLEVSISSLSVGERQRVALARVLVREAPILLLDEPDANLDRSGVALLVDLLRGTSETNTMVAFIAHDEELLRAADHVLRLRPPSPQEEALEVVATEEAPPAEVYPRRRNEDSATLRTKDFEERV